MMEQRESSAPDRLYPTFIRQVAPRSTFDIILSMRLAITYPPNTNIACFRGRKICLRPLSVVGLRIDTLGVVKERLRNKLR
jgi:hypothetical protein